MLSTRQLEVVKLLAEGYSFKQIAGQLFVSVKTVDSHKYAAMRKLGARDRADLFRWVRQQELRKSTQTGLE